MAQAAVTFQVTLILNDEDYVSLDGVHPSLKDMEGIAHRKLEKGLAHCHNHTSFTHIGVERVEV